MEHSQTRRPGSGRPSSTDARQDRHIMLPVVAARTTSRENTWAHVAPAVSPRAIGNSQLAAGLRLRVPLARLPLTPRHRQVRLLCCRESVHWRVEWRSVVFSDESRFCLYPSNGHTRVRRRPDERHLPECIRSRQTGPISGFIICGVISYNLQSDLVFLQGKVNSACYIAQVAMPVLLPFL